MNGILNMDKNGFMLIKCKINLTMNKMEQYNQLSKVCRAAESKILSPSLADIKEAV